MWYNKEHEEAESVAFIVCNHYEIDSSDYSFGYLAAWSSNKELKELQNSLDTIQKQASALITRIDTRLEVLGKEHTIAAENKIEEARTFSIYQMKSGEETKDFRFEGIDYLEKHNIILSLSMYDNIYEGTLPTNATLDNIYEEFNVNPPTDFKGHSLSVSDVIAVEYNGIVTANYIDKTGFEYVAELSKEITAERQADISVPTINAQENNIVGEIFFANGDNEKFTDIDKYIAAIKEEFPYRATTCFSFKTYTNEPQTRKAIDDIVYGEYGEENSHSIDHYADSICTITI